jgi:malonyl-CoA O-methyltransferase
MKTVIPSKRGRYVSKVIQEFSRFAYEYDRYNIIQAEVAKSLVAQLPTEPYDTLIDVGCGSGEVYKNIKQRGLYCTHFIAFDSSPQMLEVHPDAHNIEKISGDFNHAEAFHFIAPSKKNLLLSSSALQWSKDLNLTLKNLSLIAPHAYFAIFTANTFHTLHHIAGVTSPIYPEATLKEMLSAYYDATFELKTYRLKFQTVRDMFLYIKKSGVSGGEKQLSYGQMKNLMENYPLDYLEFEVLFTRGDSLHFEES